MFFLFPLNITGVVPFRLPFMGNSRGFFYSVGFASSSPSSLPGGPPPPALGRPPPTPGGPSGSPGQKPPYKYSWPKFPVRALLSFIPPPSRDTA